MICRKYGKEISDEWVLCIYDGYDLKYHHF